MAQPPSDDFDPIEVSGEEKYVVTLAEMLLAVKKQLDRVEYMLQMLVVDKAQNESKIIKP